MLAIPFAPAARDELLVDPCGRPVWPCATAEEEAALRAMARLLAVPVARAEAVPAAPAADAGETVVALGEDPWPAAKLHAHLTGRAAVRIDAPAELARLCAPAVVIARYEHCTSRLFAALVEHSRVAAIGLLTARSPERLRRVVLASAAAAVAGPIGRARLRLAEVLPDHASGVLESAHGIHLGRHAPGAIVRRMLAAGADLLVLSSHSDGLDAHLGTGLALCPVPTAEPHTGTMRAAPECQLDGRCYRLRRPISEAIVGGALVAPEHIAARVMLWHTCRGFLLSRGGLDSMWSLAERLMVNPKLGAVLLPWNSTFYNPAVRELVISLLAGASVGAALGAYARSEVVRRFHHDLCLLGDPRASLSACVADASALPCLAEDAALVETPAASEASELPAPGPRTASASHRPDEALLRLLLEHAAAAGHADAARARELLDAAAADPGFEEPAARWLATQRRGVYRIWERVADWTHLVAVTPCPTCGELQVARRATLRLPAVRPRDLVTCPICDTVADLPAGVDLKLHVTPRGLRLVGAMPSGPVRVSLAMHSHVAHVAVPWLPDANGELALPPVERPTRATLALLAGTTVAVLGALFRPEAP